jgi:CBS domain-containing protein
LQIELRRFAMAQTVREVMNPDLFAVEPGVGMEALLDSILALGITAVPVLDAERRPVGVTSLRDLVRGGGDHPISSPALTISLSATIEDAAKMMSETGRHHLVVVGSDGRAAGMLSTLDVVRALVGYPPQRPSSSPHYDVQVGVAWTNPPPFDAEHVAHAPEGAGLIVLSFRRGGRVERDVWVEACDMARERLIEMLAAPRPPKSPLADVLVLPNLRFRFAACTDTDLRTSAVRLLRARIQRAASHGRRSGSCLTKES